MNRDELLKFLKTDPKAAELRTHFLDDLTPDDFDRLVDDHLTQPDDWQEGDFRTFDGYNLRHTFSSCANPKALIVLLQGRAQSAHEYYDFIKRAHDQGYAVFTFDRRSHGNSSSYFNDGRTDHHIPDIMLQASDVADIMEYVVKQSEYKDLPRAIIGHSMGGAEAVCHAKFAKNDFKAAVYLAPMFAIHRHTNPVLNNVLKYISPLILKIVEKFGSLENPVFGRKPWDMAGEKENFSPRKSDDAVGQAIQPTITVLERAKQVGVPTWGTAKECLRMTKMIQSPYFFDDYDMPSLNLLAENDLANDTPLMRTMRDRTGMETHIMPGRHQTLNEISEIKEDAYARVFNFLKMHL